MTFTAAELQTIRVALLVALDDYDVASEHDGFSAILAKIPNDETVEEKSLWSDDQSFTLIQNRGMMAYDSEKENSYAVRF